jgi:hypothetical protein
MDILASPFPPISQLEPFRPDFKEDLAVRV